MNFFMRAKVSYILLNMILRVAVPGYHSVYQIVPFQKHGEFDLKYLILLCITAEQVWVKCYCAPSSGQIVVKLLSGYDDFYECVPLCVLFDINSQFNHKKGQEIQRCNTIIRYQKHQFSFKEGVSFSKSCELKELGIRKRMVSLYHNNL